MTNWLAGWSYRQSHVITYATSAGTNYQMKITVYSGDGTSLNGVVYCKSHCTSFPNDINFTDDSGDTALKFWIEDPTVNPVVVWVKVTGDLSTVNKTIYIYYGKTGQSSLIDGTNTFLHFNHFDDSSLSPWTTLGGTPTESGTELVINAQSEGAYGPTTTNNGRIKWRGKCTHVNYGYFGLSAAGDLGGGLTNTESFFIYSDHVSAVSHKADYTITNLGNLTTNYALWEILWVSGTSAEFLLNEVSKATHTGANVSTTAQPPKFYDYSGAPVLTLDWLFISKYVNPEPLNSTWGDEEILVTTRTITYDVDVLLQRLGITEGYDIDVLIKKLGLTKDYLIDVIFQKLGIETYSLDTVFLRTITSAYDLDVLFKKLGISKNYSIDVLLQKLGGTTTLYSIDVLFNKLGIEKTYDVDVLLQKLGLEKTYSIDVMLQKLAITKTYSIDILFQKLGIELNYSIDTILEKLGIERPYDIDTIIKRLGVENPYSIDTILKKLEVTKDYSIDVSFLGTVSKSYDLDTVIKKLGISANYLVDVIISTFKVLEESYSIDVLFIKTIDRLYSIDVVIILPTEKTYTIDTLLKKLNIPLSYAIDAIFKKLDASLTYQIDLALRKLGLTVPYNVDVMFQKLGLPKTYDIDVILQKLGVEVPYSVDTIFERQDISKQYLVDTLFGVLPTLLSYTVDAIFKKYGATQGYSIDVILKTLGIPIPTYISRRKMEIFYSFALQLPIIGALSLKFENIPIDLTGDLYLLFNWNVPLQGEIFKDLDFQIPIIGDIVKTFETPLKVLGDIIHNFEVELEMLGVFSEQEKKRRKQIDKVKRIRDLLT